jgi:hypothetical protein
MFRLALITLTLLSGANALECTAGSCWNTPANATANGCEFWDGGVDAWATCGFEGAVRLFSSLLRWVDLIISRYR